MKRLVRPSTPADVPAIIDLFAKAGLEPNIRDADLHWKYWQPRADAPGPRSFLMSSGNDAIAHAAFMPIALLWGKQRASGAHVIDWVARRGDVGAGVALLKYVAQQAGALLAIGGSADTLRILPHVGFRPSGVATGYVRTLFPSRLLTGLQPRSWRLLPRVARSLAWKLAATRPDKRGWSAGLVKSDRAIEQLSGVFPLATSEMAVMERNVAMLGYMLTCPIVPMSLFLVVREGQPGGYFLLASAPGQVRIVDCWMQSEEQADWQAMMQCIVEQAQLDRAAAEVVVVCSDPARTRAVLACGFHPRSTALIQLRPGPATTDLPSAVAVQMLDNDAGFLHQGIKHFWA